MQQAQSEHAHSTSPASVGGHTHPVASHAHGQHCHGVTDPGHAHTHGLHHHGAASTEHRHHFDIDFAARHHG